ncbi:MAG: lipid A biosynthesis acyltransferase, partial [Onishia taeanensis]
MSEDISRRDRLQATAITALWRSLAGRRLSTLWRLSAFAGPLVHRFSKRERQITETNLTIVYP